MYEQEITRVHRSAFVIAIDQSQSMIENVIFEGMTISKAAAVAKITDALLYELTLRARRDDGIRNYFDIAVLGYADDEVYPLIDPKRSFIPVSEIYDLKSDRTKVVIERTLPDGTTRHYSEERLSWIEPRAEGNTPMFEAMLQIRDLLREWCSSPQNADSFPPVVFNITDGMSSDCNGAELLAVAEQIKSLHTNDGNVLLINIHLGSGDDAQAVIFPTEGEIDADNHHMCFVADCSSVMPAPFDQLIRSQRGEWLVPPFKAMSYNASLTELIAMLNIGSRSVTNLN